QAGGERDALRVVARAGGDDAARLLLVAQARHAHVRAAHLERPRALQVLALEQHADAGRLADRAGRLDRGAVRDAVEQAGRVADVVERDGRDLLGHRAPPGASAAAPASSGPATGESSTADRSRRGRRRRTPATCRSASARATTGGCGLPRTTIRSSVPSSGNLSCPCRYSTTVLRTAASGTANSAPTIPAAKLPAATTSSTATGCSETAWPMRNGWRMCPSICCTSSTILSMTSAWTQPCATSTTSTAIEPVTMAPTI